MPPGADSITWTTARSSSASLQPWVHTTNLHRSHVAKCLAVAPLHTTAQPPPTTGKLVACTSPQTASHLPSLCSARHMALNLQTNVQNPEGVPSGAYFLASVFLAIYNSVRKPLCGVRCSFSGYVVVIQRSTHCLNTFYRMHEQVSQTKEKIGCFKTMKENQQTYLNRRELHSCRLLCSQ